MRLMEQETENFEDMPEVLRVGGEESRRNGSHKLSSQQVDYIFKATRACELQD